MAVVEVACDESGSEGEHLVGGETDVFAHGSVRLSSAAAARCVHEVRERIGSPAQEYKANHLLRHKHRAVLEWLLAESGPIHGSARVHLVDKTFFFVGKVVELLIHGADEQALVLYRDGERAFGRRRWAAFLSSFNGLMRSSNRRGVETSVESFYRTVDGLRSAGAPAPVREVIELLWLARSKVDAFRGSPETFPPLDPMIPAIVATVTYWSAGGAPVRIVHDEQPALTPERIARLTELLDGRLAGLRFVDSRSDSRVQVADFLAGVARHIASAELNGRGDVTLTALLRPYVDTRSIWGDARSAALLGPTSPG